MRPPLPRATRRMELPMDNQRTAPAPEVALRNLGLALVELSWALQGRTTIPWPPMFNDLVGDIGDELLREIR